MKFSRENCCGMTALITGADSGIGLCFSRELASKGVNLIMISNRQVELAKCAEEIAAEFGVKTTYLCLDLSERDAALKVMNFVESENLEFSLLINNAGIFDFKAVTDLSPGRIDLYCGLHVTNLTQLTRLVAGQWREKGVKGYILNMSSMSCWMPMPGIAMYSATKAYIRVFSRALAYELKDDGISVTVACPGGIATDLFGLPKNLQRFAVRIGVLQTPEKFVKKALKKTFARKLQYINGGLNRMSIFFVGITPTCVRMFVKHRLLDRLNKK